LSRRVHDEAIACVTRPRTIVRRRREAAQDIADPQCPDFVGEGKPSCEPSPSAMTPTWSCGIARSDDALSLA
jgi:hypothetical protein